MARKKHRPLPAAPAPTRAELQEAAAALERLMAEGFASTALLHVLDAHRDEAGRVRFARAMAQVVHTNARLQDQDVELATQVATLLVLLVGVANTADILFERLQQAESEEANTIVLLMGDALGIEFTSNMVLPQLPAEIGEQMLESLDGGDDGHYALLEELVLMPHPFRDGLIEVLLRAGDEHPSMPAFATLALMGLLDEESKRPFRTWLTRRAPAAAAWVERIARGKAPGPSPFPVLAASWPVVAAYATFSDGCGSQGLYLVRRRPDGELAVASAVVNDWRGLADGMGHPRVTEAEQRELLGHVAGTGLVPIPPDHLLERISGALAVTRERDLPVPLFLRVYWNLLQGLPNPTARATASLAGWAKGVKLADTEALADESFFQRWYLEPTGDPATEPFFAAVRALLLAPRTKTKRPADLFAFAAGGPPTLSPRDEAELDAAIERALPAVFHAEARRRWSGRLAEVAYLYDRLGEKRSRDLAAAASVALAPESGVDLAAQPLPGLVLHQSAYRDAMQDDTELFDQLVQSLAQLAGVRAPAPRKGGPSTRQTKVAKSGPAAGSGEIFQIKIALKGTKPPIWRRVLVSAAITLPELHEVIQRAMGWHNYHMHAFTIHGEEYGVPAPHDFFDVENERGKRLDRLVDAGDKFTYEYDFGDSWTHQVTVEKRLPRDPALAYPVCTKGKGACPPEDSGGLWGYYEKLDILADPGDPDHEEVREWMGDEFDPDAFDLDEVNARLAPAPARRGRKRKD